ncbi:hypothetical protein RQP46_004567 [Phenoliferia psychrophenolica]
MLVSLTPAYSVLSLFLGAGFATQGSLASPHGAGHLFAPTNYSIVPDIFIQDSPTFNATGYDVLSDSFGLIDKSKGRWKKFASRIHHLNKYADEDTTYKVIYIARHGQGFHNVAETQYGTPLWNCKYSLLTTDGNLTWGPDAKLSPLGISQAEAVNAGWKEQRKAGIPLPKTLYSSPLSRSASTLNITWKDILIDPKGVRPQFRENFRSNKTYLEETYPSFDFEPSFTEHDELWNSIYQEQSLQQSLRTQQILNDIFATNPHTYISITAHSGTITSFLRAVNHRPVSVQPGGFVPVVVKAVRKKNQAPGQKTRRYKRDIDQILDDIKDGGAQKIKDELERKDIEELPGMAEHGCLACSRYFATPAALATHVTGKPHKRRLKKLEEEPYTIEESRRAAGFSAPDNGASRETKGGLVASTSMDVEPVAA